MVFQRPKRTHKAKYSREQHPRIFRTIRGGYRSLSSKTRVVRQIAPESSPERSAKSLSHSFFVVPCLSPINRSIPHYFFVGTLTLRNTRPATGIQNPETRNSSKKTQKLPPPGPDPKFLEKNSKKTKNTQKILLLGYF